MFSRRSAFREAGEACWVMAGRPQAVSGGGEGAVMQANLLMAQVRSSQSLLRTLARGAVTHNGSFHSSHTVSAFFLNSLRAREPASRAEVWMGEFPPPGICGRRVEVKPIS